MEHSSQVLRGSFRYAIGDHGGIIVAVQHYRTAGEIDTLYYSTDDGESWKTFKFSDEVRIHSSPIFFSMLELYILYTVNCLCSAELCNTVP